MHTVELAEAKKQLPQLIEGAAECEDIIIRHPDGLTFRIVPAAEQRPQPTLGSARGIIRFSDDFDAPLNDFEHDLP